MELNIFEKLKESFDTSTLSNNRFKTAIDSILWDDAFTEEGEYYFRKGELTFITPSLEPFNITGYSRPAALFTDGSYIEF